MVVRQRSLKTSDIYFAEFYNIPKELLTWFDNIVYENNCCIEKKEWKSKYNSYVIYDYEPFCSDGFDITVVVSSFNRDYLEFIKYLYESKISLISYLNECIAQ